MFGVQPRGDGGGLEAVPRFEEVTSKLFLTQWFVVDAYTFSNEAKVWRSVKANFREGPGRRTCGCVEEVGQYGGDESRC